MTDNNQFDLFDNRADGSAEDFLQYVKSLNPDAVEQLSQPKSPEVFQMMERNITGMLGGLPAEQFGVTVSTSRENLGRLLASAMMSGYFLRNAEQRFHFERSLSEVSSSDA